MSDVLDEINAAIERLSLSSERIRRCTEAEARSIVERARETYVTGDPRVWWLSLKVPAEQFPYERSGYRQLASILGPDSEHCWFIPETEEGALPVFECVLDALCLVLDECSFFEYYVLGIDFSWLAIDTDHNVILVCRRAATG